MLVDKGFFIEKNIFNDDELNLLKALILSSEKKYAIRQLVNKEPEILKLIFKNDTFKKLYGRECTEDFFLTKAIFFNKPSKSNWFVSHHQDVSISVKEKIATEGYSGWTNKDGQLGVIPPKEILENTITFRIHLDDTDSTNGALRVIPNSHKKGIIRVDEYFNKNNLGEEVLCEVPKGGVMLMKPLLLHASSKSTSAFDRRVIHLEFCNKEISMGWLERKEVI